MAASIITKRRRAVEREKLVKPEHYSEYHKGVVVDSRYENLANLITHIEGSEWKVNYFKQILDTHSSVAGHNPTKDEIYQQYLKIEELILKVDTALSWQQVNETKSGNVTGSAHVYPPLIPNHGDMFIGDIGDGNPAIFEVTIAEKLSLYKQAVYRIEYKLVDYASDERLVDLENKVVERKFFEKDFNEHGQNPLISTEEKKYLNAINHYYPIILENYFKNYYSTRFRCMILPRSDMFIYDHFLTKAISRWYSARDYYKLQELKAPAIDNIKVMRAESIFDLIEDQDLYGISNIFTKVGMISVNAYATLGRIPQSARMGLDTLIYPIDHPYSIDTKDKLSIDIKLSPSSIPFVEYREFKEDFKNIPLIPDINLNESYIFSRNFYRLESSLLSHIELQTMRYLQGNDIQKEILYSLMESQPKWSDLQKFYLTPILLMLLNASKRRL